MQLKVKSNIKRPGVVVVSPIGSINTATYRILEEKVDNILTTPTGCHYFRFGVYRLHQQHRHPGFVEN